VFLKFTHHILLYHTKHIYDLAIFLVDYRILSLIQNKKLVDKLIHIKKREEKSRIGSELANCLIKNFHYFHDSKNNKELLSAFVKMQSIYVFNENDRMSTQSLIDTVDTLVRIF